MFPLGIFQKVGVVAWVLPKAEPKMTACVQMFYLGDGPREQEGKKRKEEDRVKLRPIQGMLLR